MKLSHYLIVGLITLFGIQLYPKTANAGKKLVVAVLDTGLNLKDPRLSSALCPSGHKDMTGTGITDTHGHGTHVVGLIKQHAANSDYCLVIVKYHTGGDYNPRRAYVKALRYIGSLKPDIVNYSGGGYIAFTAEFDVYGANPSMLLVAAAGNNRKPVHEFFPAALHLWLPNVVAVGNKDTGCSNFGPKLVYEQGKDVYSTLPNGKYGTLSGTSMSAAIRTGKIVYERTH